MHASGPYSNRTAALACGRRANCEDIGLLRCCCVAAAAGVIDEGSAFRSKRWTDSYGLDREVNCLEQRTLALCEECMSHRCAEICSRG
jgi:hypothetical protein